MPTRMDSDTIEYARETRLSIDRIRINIFMCGAGVASKSKRKSSHHRRDLRLFMRDRLRSEISRCDVKLGEHRRLIRAFRAAVGKSANLADHEVNLAKRKKMDLIVVFPCSPGSFAELGMFSVADRIASKMVVFVDKAHRSSNSYLIEGPIKAAKLRTAKVQYVDYRNPAGIWSILREIVLEVKNRKRARRALA